MSIKDFPVPEGYVEIDSKAYYSPDNSADRRLCWSDATLLGPHEERFFRPKPELPVGRAFLGRAVHPDKGWLDLAVAFIHEDADRSFADLLFLSDGQPDETYDFADEITFVAEIALPVEESK